MRAALYLGATVLLGANAACDRARLGIPGTALSLSSPDGTRVAYVANHPSLDPPSQSLWLRTPDGRNVKLVQLSEDQDWCNRIVWSPDGARVGFLVQDSRLALVEAATAKVVSWTVLVDDDRDYPTAEVVTDLGLSQDGLEATYRICPRASAAAASPACGSVRSRRLVSTAAPEW
jgi:hypothetical protein